MWVHENSDDTRYQKWMAAHEKKTKKDVYIVCDRSHYTYYMGYN